MGVIRDIDKGGGEVIRVELSEFKGKTYLNIRIWYMDKNTNELRPSQKGVTIKPELYSQLKDALLSAEPEIQKLLSANPEPETLA